MNVSFTLVKKYLLYALFCLPVVAYAQLEQHEVIAGESFDYVVSSSPNSAAAEANHGSINKTYIGSGQYKLTYTADDGFLGLDTMAISYWENFQPTAKGIELKIIPSKVIAQNDYATTISNQAIEIDVLGNDFSSRDVLILSGIPLVEHCTAVITPDNTVIFIPNPDFDGLARFNYTICDDIGTCATGTVNVSVIGTNPPQPQDTVYVSTTKNTSLPIPLNYADYTIDDAPTNGSLLLDQNLVEYEPALNYVGLDKFVLKRIQNGVSYYKVFMVNVLSTQDPNGVVFDDYAYTAINEAVAINVTSNDVGNYTISSFTQPTNGEVIQLTDDVLRYIPTETFQGVASFTYSVNIGLLSYETASVYVYVDNQNPGNDEYHFSTEKNVPKPLPYEVPIEDFTFNIASQASFGVVNFYPGTVDTLIYGHHITGHNLVIYTPNVDFVGTDEFELMYCVPSNGLCDLTKVIMEVTDTNMESCISEDCVWPGDGNNDGVVNMIDILHLGLSFGDLGEVRSNASLLWHGQFVDDWNKSAIPGLDAKFADMDGDGIVAANDLDAMDSCYYLTHALTPSYNAFEKNYPIYLEAKTASPYGRGDLVEYDILLGRSHHPALDLHGITYSFNYNTVFVEDSIPVSITFNDNSWFSQNSTVLHLSKEPFAGRVDFGLTRTNGFTASGHGSIGTLSFVIEDDIEGIKSTKFTIKLSDIIGMDSANNYVQLADVSIDVPITLEGDAPLRASDLHTYPNPTDGLLYVHLNGNNTIQSYAIYSMMGQLMHQAVATKQKQEEIHLESLGLSAGMYILHVQTEKGPVATKIQLGTN